MDMNYEKALQIMEIAEKPECQNLVQDEFEQACKKSVQALKDCLEMGLNGEGE